jgi:hypothetical protein
MLMPFGKFAGWQLEDLPQAYLTWLKSRTNLRDPLRSCVQFEWERRLQELREPVHSDRGVIRVPFEHRELFAEVVESGYRTVAMRVHPDRGGDPVRMRALNALVEELREQINVARN